MTNPAIPSKDPGTESDLASTLRAVIDKYMKSVDGMLPATVVAYNRATNRATVVPTVNMVMTNATIVARAPVANIPVLALGGGDYSITFPLKAGDTGWIEASDRDISLWLQNGGRNAANPNTHRIHSFSDGRFIPDALANYTLSPYADGGMCIQQKDGTTAIILKDDQIVIVAPVNVTVKCPDVFFDGQVVVNQNIAVDPGRHYP